MAVTQDELYATLDLELSWSERALPEHVRTKHVHRLHPYHGKFIPQLVEVLLDRYLGRGSHVLDPFAGSGTTLVQALESGLHATGVELAAFNCLLIGVKTSSYDVETLGAELRDAYARLDSLGAKRRAASAYVKQWYATQAAAELLAFRAPRCAFRSRGSARAADRRVLVPQAQAPVPSGRDRRWLSPPLHARHACPHRGVRRDSRHGVRRTGAARRRAHGRVRRDVRRRSHLAAVSGLIDYHEQHRYAYELLGLDDRRELELGAAEAGTSKASLEAYREGIAKAFANAASALAPGARVLVVVNDRRDLYPEILDRAGLRLEERLRRHVNRPTGRRAGEYFEDVLVARAA